MKNTLILCVTFLALLTPTRMHAEAHYPSAATSEERAALDRLASEVQGALIYTRNGRVKKVTIGDWRVEDLSEGDFVRWGPLGKRIAVQQAGAVYVMNADGSDRKKVIDGGVRRGDGCQIEFHTNGREIIYGTEKSGLWAVEIETGKKRDLDLPFNTEINISADGKRMVMRSGDCFLVELPGTTYRKFAGGCSPCVSPDGTRMTSNEGGHKTMNIREWNGNRIFQINARDMQPDRAWDNMHWSNHDDFIAMQGDGKPHEAYAFRVSKNQGTRLTWEGGTKYPDLFISKDLKTGDNPMELTLAWAELNGPERTVASAPKPKPSQKTEVENLQESREAANSSDAKGRAAEVRALTGGPTRVVWAQSIKASTDYCAIGKNYRLVGFCTEDGKGERVILSDVTSYGKPIFTPDGDHVVYSDRSNNKMYILNWDGSGRRELGSGYASDVWRDPNDGKVWLYYRAGDGKTEGGVMRQQLDNPTAREKVWDQPTGHDSVPWFRLSADGTRFADAFPWGTGCGVAEPAGSKWEHYSKGCWPSMAPDNSYRYFAFLGSHQEIGLYDAGKKNYRKINVAGGPGVGGKEKVYHPRWGNDARFITVTGPKGSDKQEILLGRFDADFTKVEKWVRISENNQPDFYGDAWIKSGWLAKLNQEPKGVVAQKPASPKAQPELSKFDQWPGDQRDLLFLWENNDVANQIVGENGQGGRMCQVVARDRAVFGRFYEMDLAGGAVVAKDADDALLKACKQSNQLTIEATITPRNAAQRGSASIVSFSKDSGASNFTLGQEQDTLVLELHTPDTAKQGARSQVALCKIEPGRPHHLVVSYQSGKLTCHVNGRRVLETGRVTGDFSNWEPAHLLFGDEWKGGSDWSGSLEGVAIYARAVSEPEAVQKHGLYAARFRERQPVERLVVRGRLLEITPTPAVKDLQEYSRGMVVYSYEVVEVLHGKEPAGKIQVAHWAILDRKLVPEITRNRIGQVYNLQLESFGKHPELESERSFNDCEDFDVPLYYDIAGRGVSVAPAMLSRAAPERAIPKSNKPGIHLKINCAGPGVADWESDQQYVARDKTGGAHKFNRTADTSDVRYPAPVEIYQTVRHRPHGYNFELPNGEYLVRLHFTDENDPKGNIRKMDFVIEDQRVLSGFNVVSTAGGVGRAVVREIPVVVSDGNGLQIKGEDPRGGDVFVAGIEIVSR